MKKIAIMIENRFMEQEIIYYQHRFAQAGLEAEFISRLWGNDSLTFKGIEWGMPFVCGVSLEEREPQDYAALIMPAGYVADMLRYSEKPGGVSPAVDFMRRAMEDEHILKCVICHSAWVFDPIPEIIRGRRLTCHNNIVGSVRNAGGVYVDEDIHLDGDLLSARTGGHFAPFAERIITILTGGEEREI